MCFGVRVSSSLAGFDDGWPRALWRPARTINRQLKHLLKHKPKGAQTCILLSLRPAERRAGVLEPLVLLVSVCVCFMFVVDHTLCLCVLCVRSLLCPPMLSVKFAFIALCFCMITDVALCLRWICVCSLFCPSVLSA